MKSCLIQITKNEEYFLVKTLSLMRSLFDGMIVIDACSTDRTVEILESFEAQVISKPWDCNYGGTRNLIIEEAIRQGYETAFMIDPDEAMWPEDIVRIKQELEICDLITVPRHEILWDGTYVDKRAYPDFHDRFFRLDSGIRYKGKIHEILHAPNGRPARHALKDKVLDCHLYHYGSARKLAQIYFKHNNYRLISLGEEPLARLPKEVEESFEDTLDGVRKMFPFMEEFHEPHPLQGQLP